MAEWIEPREITDELGKPIGKFRLTRRTDDPITGIFALCPHKHDTSEEARLCPEARKNGGWALSVSDRKASSPTTSELVAALKRMVDDYENYSEERSGEPSCPICTDGVTPTHLDKGPCAYHQAKTLLSRVGA